MRSTSVRGRVFRREFYPGLDEMNPCGRALGAWAWPSGDLQLGQPRDVERETNRTLSPFGGRRGNWNEPGGFVARRNLDGSQ